MKSSKTIHFRGREISPQEARAMIQELTVSLERYCPDTSDNPAGQIFRQLKDPRWYCEPVEGGTLFCVRDNGAGWRGYIIPWEGVSILMGLFAKQLAGVAASAPLTAVVKH